MRTAPFPDDAGHLRRLLIDAREVCERLGLTDGAKPQARGLLVRCPWHADRTPSCSVRTAPDGTIAAVCHACGRTGDVLDLIAAASGMNAARDNFPEALRLAAAIAGADLDALPPPRPAPERAPERDYPPAGEVAAVWAACRAVTADAEVSACLASRALAAADVELYGLAQALPLDVPTLCWARFQGSAWAEGGYRLVVPMYDAAGALRSLRARRVTPGEGPKALPPAGHRVGGLVMACPLGRSLLETGAVPLWWSPGETLRVVIAEGEIDFLTWATRFSDADETAPAVLGILSGAWTPEIAARVPDGARVVVWTDPDEAGERYASVIVETLRGRCDVFRGGVS